MAENEDKLRALAKFENMFVRENFQIGLQVWLRTTVPMLLAGVLFSVTGIIAAMPDPALIALTVFNLFLFQWAASLIAAKKYKMAISPFCWWSIYWRLVLFIVPVFMLLVYQAYPELTEETLRANPGPMETAMLIVHLLSMIPMGLVTSRALLASFQRQKSLGAN